MESMIDLGLRGRVALVTGAAEGVGRHVARLFAAEGAWIAVNYFADAHGAKSLIDEIRSSGGRAMLVPGSARDAEGAWRIAQIVELEWAQIDILIHTAALLDGSERVSDAGPMLEELAPAMQKRGWGRIVMFTPVGAPLESTPLPRSPVILTSVIRFSRDQLHEPAARLALFLGSEWNSCITNHTFEIDKCSPKEVRHDAR
jgi:hypothetical protein